MRINPTRETLRGASRRSAFTLMEVLVVVAILVVLASVASVYVFRYLDDSKISAAKSSAKTLADACDAYTLASPDGQPPENLGMLTQPADGRDPYIKDPSTLMDPWGKQFQLNIMESSSNAPVIEVWTTTPQGKRISSIKNNNQV